MGMNVGAQNMASMMSKAQQVGFAQQLRTDQTVKETDRQRETEAARDSDPESSTASNTRSVGSSSGANRAQVGRGLGQEEARGLSRLERGGVEWQEQEKNQGSEWLPPSLRPQAKGAGTSNAFNIPYWLEKRDQQQESESPLAAHRKLLTGLKNMVNTEIQQYVKSNEPPYAKKTLREIYNVLQEESTGGAPPQQHNVTGEVAGLNAKNWSQAQNTFNMLENPQPELGEAFEMVA